MSYQKSPRLGKSPRDVFSQIFRSGSEENEDDALSPHHDHNVNKIISKYDINDVFSKVIVYKHFKEYLKSVFSEETLLFYEEIQSFKHLSDGVERYKKANEIIESYVVTKAEKEVNLTSKEKKTLLDTPISEEHCSLLLFDAAFDELKRTVLLESWRAFQSSSQYEDMMTETLIQSRKKK
jgi:hypothetical protein